MATDAPPLPPTTINETAASPSPASQPSQPSQGAIDDLLLDCRYGDIDSVRTFVSSYGVAALASARDERGNSVLHMCAANGHDDILEYILALPSLPSSLLISRNDAGNTPLHWTCLNTQLSIAKQLIAFRPSSFSSNSQSTAYPINSQSNSDSDSNVNKGPESDVKLGPALIFAHNTAGHTPLGEAELAGWDNGAQWLVSIMDVEVASASASLSPETKEESSSSIPTDEDDKQCEGEGDDEPKGRDGTDIDIDAATSLPDIESAATGVDTAVESEVKRDPAPSSEQLDTRLDRLQESIDRMKSVNGDFGFEKLKMEIERIKNMQKELDGQEKELDRQREMIRRHDEKIRRREERVDKLEERLEVFGRTLDTEGEETT